MKTTAMKKFLLSILAVFLGLWLWGGAAHAASGSTGKEFYFSFQPNLGTGTLSLFITGRQDTTGTVEIPSLKFSASFSVTANKVTTVTIPNAAQQLPANSVSKLAIRVVAGEDVAVYGLNQVTFTTDAFLALPVDALGVDYYALSYISNVGYPSQLVVVGAFDGTQVTITPSAKLNNHPAGTPFTVNLNRGETYMLTADGQGDVSGTSISASAPIAVMAGVQCVNVPTGAYYCDHIVEMMPPVSTWGKSFLTVPLATRTNGDVFRILAAQDGTKVHINGSLVATLNRGKFFETVLKTRSHIDTSAPVLVSQYSAGTTFDGVTSDPFMMLIPPTEQFMDQYTFSTPATGFSANYVNVVVPSGEVSSLRLGGVPVDASKFSPIATSGFSGAQLHISLGSHHITSATNVPFGIYVYGYAAFDSYGYPGGMSFKAINPVGDKFTPGLRLVQTGDVINGTATDSEDANSNGILDAGEDLNGNGKIDRRSEDLNGNGKLDAGEDTNGDGILDRDTGVLKIQLLPGTENLKLDIVPFVPGSLSAAFSITRIDITKPGKGVVQIEDGAGNIAEAPVLIGGVAVLKNVRVIETISTSGIDVDLGSFAKTPFSVTEEPGKKYIEWRFDTFSADSRADLGFDITIKNPVPGEKRLVSHKLDLFYTDANGKPVHTALDSRSVDVLPSIYQVMPSTDKVTYGPSETVQISSIVKNLSAHPGSAGVKLSILDGNNALVSVLGMLATQPIASGGAAVFNGLNFTTGNTYTGNYKVLAEVVDNLGNVVAFGSAPFAIGIASGSGAKAAVVTDKQSYKPFDAVRIHSRVTNALSNASLDDVRATTTLRNPDGTVRFNKTETLQQLPPSQLKDYAYDIALATAPAGQYAVTLVVTKMDGTEVAKAATQFAVGSTAETGAGLVGTISSPTWLNAGQTADLNFNATNNGNGQLTNLPLKVTIVDPAKQLVVAEYPYSTTLPVGGTYSGTAKWIATVDSGAAYVAILTATVGGKELVLAQSTITVLKLDINQSVHNSSRVLVLVSCKDELSEEATASSDVQQCETQRSQTIASVLTTLGVSHLITINESAFRQALRSGIYNTYWISGKQDKLHGDLAAEVREAVFAGDGLILDGVHDQRNRVLDAAAGITYRGKLGETNLPVEIGGPVFESQTLITAGRALKLLLNGGMQQAVFNGEKSNSNGPAIVTHVFGAGCSVLYAFDLVESLLAQPQWQQILAHGLQHVMPALSGTLVPGSLVPVKTSVTNQGPAAEVIIKSSLPPGAALMGSNPTGNYDASANTVEWAFTLPEAQSKDAFLTLRVPSTAGEFLLQTTISTVHEGASKAYGESLILPIQVSSAAQNSVQVAAALKAYVLTQKSDQKARDTVLAKLQNAITYFDKQTPAGYEAAIGTLIQAIDQLSSLTVVDTAAARQGLDRILKEAQWHWAQSSGTQEN